MYNVVDHYADYRRRESHLAGPDSALAIADTEKPEAITKKQIPEIAETDGETPQSSPSDSSSSEAESPTVNQIVESKVVESPKEVSKKITLQEKIMLEGKVQGFYKATNLLQNHVDNPQDGMNPEAVSQVLDAFNVILESPPNDFIRERSLYFRFNCLEQLGDDTSSTKAFDEFLAFVEEKYGEETRIEMLHREAQRSYHSRDFLAAMKYYQRLLTEYPNSHFSEKAYLAVGKYYYEVHQYERALKIFRHFIKEYSDSNYVGEAAYWVALSHFALRDHEGGISALKGILEEHRAESYAAQLQYHIAYFSYLHLGHEYFASTLREFRKIFNEYPEETRIVRSAKKLEKSIRTQGLKFLELP